MTKMPHGELAIQTLAMPMNTNANGDVFGGWLVSQMDLAAGILAKQRSRGRAATVAIDSMSFLEPVHVGEVVSCYVHLIRLGKTSMAIKVEVWKEEFVTAEKKQVTEGTFTFVAIDEHGCARAVEKGPT
ncbi:MAG: acyl-CoA thioesterase [Gammaproteobacteria bacterium]|nr:acyl-CoA thioesterase [Gammaproteobacteria bacterium]MCH9717668.1 acyl-CoA thioesterase [Gammaproteobacteria bacterium]MCH9763159.1 acyl-CoA thioesterase [Gammaproteobacteria bacterium]